MVFELAPLTDPRQRFTALAEQHALDFAGRVQKQDREGTYPLQNLGDMKRSGAILTTLPKDMGAAWG